MENFFNNKSIFQVIGKWKYHLAGIIFASVIISSVFSLFIPEKFKSSAILYPVNLPTFSEESNTEQMLQIVESIDIRKKLFKKFNLGTHYKLDTTAEHYFTNLNKEFEGNVSFSKTEYEAVEIEVYDTDPQLASDMVVAIVDFYNEMVRQMHRDKHEEVVTLKKILLEKVTREIDSLENVKREHQTKYGLFDFGNQSKEATKRYIKLLAEGKGTSQSARQLQEILDNLKKKGIENDEVGSLLWSARNLFNNTKLEYENELIEVAKEITYAQYVTKPFPADKKSTPVRWIIVLFSALGTFLVGVIAIIIAESVKK